MAKKRNEYKLESYDDPLIVFEYLRKKWREDIDDNTYLQNIALELTNKYNINLCIYAVQAIGKGFSAFDAHHILESVIPETKLDLDSLIEYIRTIYMNFQNDLMSGRQYQPIITITKKNPNFAEKLLNKLIEINEQFTLGFISSIIENLQPGELEQTHKKISKLIFTDNKYLQQACIISLGNLKYDISADKNLIKNTLSIFDELKLLESSQINGYICGSLCELYYLGDEVEKRITNFANLQNPNISFFISKFLMREYKSLLETQWFENLLMTFTSTNCEYKGVLNELDHLFYSLLNYENKVNLITTFMYKWCLNSDFSEKGLKIDSIFKSTMVKLIQDSPNLSKIITKYFLDDNFVINRIASELITFSNVRKKQFIYFNSDIIKSLELTDIVYLMKKLLGFVYDVKTLCTLLISIIKEFPDDTKVSDLSLDIFINYLGTSQPNTVIKHLDDLSIEEQSDKVKKIILKAHNILKAQLKERQNIPKLKELDISLQENFKISVEENKVMSQAMEQTTRDSIFLQLATSIPLKYGNSWFSYNNGEYSEPNKLTSQSQSFERSRSEINDPVGSNYEKTTFRLTKRGKS